MANTSESTTPFSVEIKAQQELRFEVNWGSELELKVLTGRAEIFGAELAANRTYKFTEGTKLAVFTYHGATVELNIDANHYVAEAGSTPMNTYMECHTALEEQRSKAAMELQSMGKPSVTAQIQDVVRGPRVLIAGPTDSGKSSLSKILINYAMRLKRDIFFVDLDVGQSQIAIPGVVGVTAVSEPIDVVEEFNLCAPIAFFYGHNTPSKNVKHYKMLTEHIGQIIKLKSILHQQFAVGGFIVNTCGWVDGLGYDLLKYAAASLQVDHILVLGDDKLTSSFKKDFPNVNVVRMRKSGGVVTRSKEFRSKSRMRKIKEYFYGINGTLSPHSITIKFDDLLFYRVGATTKALSASALPIGMKSSVDPCELKTVEPNERLKHNVLAVSYATNEKDILLKNIHGLIYVTNVDMEKQEITLLSPSPGKLPSKYLVVGSIEWLDM